MKILLTGSSGLVGQAFIQRYGDIYTIIGFDISEGMDILNLNQLMVAMQGCDMIVHAAAIPKPKVGYAFDQYYEINCTGTKNICEAAYRLGISRIIYISSTTYYGIERGIPYTSPIKEDQMVLSQYIQADDLSCRDVDLFYHHSKVIAEQIVACYGLSKKVQSIVLRLAPVGKVFLGTSVGYDNACHAIHCALQAKQNFWYEPFSIVDPDIAHISHDKATKLLGYTPTKPIYTPSQIH